MGRPIRVGVQLPEVEREVRWPEYVAMAHAAEEVGFDSVFVGDHYLYRGDGQPERGPWEAWTLLSALAAATERVTLAPLVACTAYHNPAVLAKMAATVDEVSGGRLVLGLGAGWNEPEFRAFGIPFEHRASRFEEAFGIIRRLLSGDRVTLEGRFYTVEDAVLLPPPARRPPLMIGSRGERVLTAALPHADAWNTWHSWYGNTAKGFSALNQKVDAIAEGAGRDPAEIDRSVCVLVAIGEAPDRRNTEGVTPLEGPPELIAQALREFAEIGADEAILVLSPISEKSIRAAGEALAVLDG